MCMYKCKRDHSTLHHITYMYMYMHMYLVKIISIHLALVSHVVDSIPTELESWLDSIVCFNNAIPRC